MYVGIRIVDSVIHPYLMTPEYISSMKGVIDEVKVEIRENNINSVIQ